MLCYDVFEKLLRGRLVHFISWRHLWYALQRTLLKRHMSSQKVSQFLLIPLISLWLFHKIYWWCYIIYTICTIIIWFLCNIKLLFFIHLPLDERKNNIVQFTCCKFEFYRRYCSQVSTFTYQCNCVIVWVVKVRKTSLVSSKMLAPSKWSLQNGRSCLFSFFSIAEHCYIVDNYK